MKRLLSMFGLVMIFASPLMAQGGYSCLGTVAQAKEAQELKKEAVDLRAQGDYIGAAAKFTVAADSHPMAPIKASYLMNAVGCLLGTYHPVKGYRWHEQRGPENAVKAQELLNKVNEILNWCEENKCLCASAPVGKTRAWYNNQVKFLKSQTK